MKDIYGKDFNTTFWKIFGVNHRVYKASDSLNIKRDKQADEKKYNNFRVPLKTTPNQVKSTIPSTQK